MEGGGERGEGAGDHVAAERGVEERVRGEGPSQILLNKRVSEARVSEREGSYSRTE